jgi:multidrug efflux pump subunit AcrA (membrane-fusion protein)
MRYTLISALIRLIRVIRVPLLCLLLLSCSSKKEEQTEENVSTVLPDEISEVRAIRLEYTGFQHELIANGVVSAQNKVDLKFPASENVSAIYVKNGDKVRKGQKIAQLEPFKLQNNLAQAKDNLARARLELQDVLIGQGYSLNDTAAVPAEVMQLAKVKSNYDQSLIQYDLSEYNYKNSVLYAPFEGIVANLFTKVYNRRMPDKRSAPLSTRRIPEWISKYWKVNCLWYVWGIR